MKLFLKLIFGMLDLILAILADIEFTLWADSHSSIQIIRRIWLKIHNVSFDKKVFIGKNVYLRGQGRLVIGNRTSIGSFSRIWKYSDITIGEDFMSAGALTINTGGHDPQTMEPFSKPILIGNRVWCGMNVTILPGIKIGDDVVIAAGCIVTKDVPPGVVVAGIPGKVIRKLEKRDYSHFWRPKW